MKFTIELSVDQAKHLMARYEKRDSKTIRLIDLIQFLRRLVLEHTISEFREIEEREEP